MNYNEMVIMENAFSDFLTQQKRQNEITVYYYKLLGYRNVHDCSYMGYETNLGGFHGIHFDRITNSYYFGTRNKHRSSTLLTLRYGQVNIIPKLFRTMFINVSHLKQKISVRKPDWKAENLRGL